MQFPKVYVPCYDESLPIIKVNSYLFDKHWPDAEVHYLGFKSPDFQFYNKNHHFHSLAEKQEGGASNWTRYIYNFLKDSDESHVMLSIDDYWLCSEPNFEMLHFAHNLMKTNDNIGRFDLTFDSQVEGNMLKIPRQFPYNIRVKHPQAQYRISTQPAMWSRKYLLEFLDNDWSPWQFELLGTQHAAKNHLDTNHTFAFWDDNMSDYPIRTIAKGAVSRHNKGKYNVLGLPVDTIKKMVELKFFTEEELIWGQWQGNVPSFSEKGGYDFHPGFLQPHPTSKTDFKEYYSVYDDPDCPMLTVNLFDNSFSHTLTHPDFGYISTNAEKSPRGKKIRFTKGNMDYNRDCGVTLFTDHALRSEIISSVNSPVKIGWILEPPAVHSWAYENIDSYIGELDYLLTFSEEISQKYEKAHTFSWCSIRLDHSDWGVHEKTKMVSMIASKKTYAPGHKLRHDTAIKLSEKHNIDLWGGGFKDFPQHGKILALKDYMFSIVIQNCQLDTFFTDLVDPLATGTVPIFWGTRKIDEHFNTDGIIFFDTLEELDEILSNLTEDDYYSRMEAINDNYNRAKSYWRSDDQIAAFIHKLLKEEK